MFMVGMKGNKLQIILDAVDMGRGLHIGCGWLCSTYESCYIGPKLVHSIVIWFFLIERTYDLGFGTKEKLLASSLGLGLSLL
jgi:hypothetical protein